MFILLFGKDGNLPFQKTTDRAASNYYAVGVCYGYKYYQ